MKIGFCVIPRSLHGVEELARIADASDASWFGIADSPVLYTDAHTAVHAALAVTSNIRIGTFVTNPITRHWSVQASFWRSMSEKFPGRTFMGIAAGDSAVHSVGLPPATPGEVQKYVERVREHAPGVETIVAAGGPKSVAAAGQYAENVAIGQGVSAATRSLLETALAQRSVDQDQLRPWMPLIVNLVRDGTSLRLARDMVKSTLVAFSRQAFAGSFEGKAVEQSLQQPLRLLYQGYDFAEHSALGASRNAELLPSGSDLEEFLFDRFTVVGPPAAVAGRLLAIVDAVGVENFVLTIEVPETADLLRHVCADVLPKLPIEHGGVI